VNAFQCETEFLSGVVEKLEAAKGTLLRGTNWERIDEDESDQLRALMAEARCYDRGRLKSLPANRRIEIRGFERRLLFGRKPTCVAIATVISPLEHFAQGGDGDAPPVGLAELTDHVRKLAKQGRVPHVIGVCSPSGFSEEARNARLDSPGVTVVLVEPDGHGGWHTRAADATAGSPLVQIFDPEGANQKLKRVRELIEKRSADLLTGGLSVSSIARQANLPESLVREAFRRAAEADDELQFADKDGDSYLYRGAPVRGQEKRAMNVVDRIKQIFSNEGDEVTKVNVLSQRRAALAQRRDRIYEDIGKLETKEAELLAEGKAAVSQVPRRRIAAQLAQLRKDISRQNATASMLNKQIDIISTDIHNLTLIRQGEMAQLPDTTELTANAVRAEEMLESLNADAEMVSSLESGMEQTLASDEELAILREFEEVPAPAQPTSESTSEKSVAVPRVTARDDEARAAIENVSDERASSGDADHGRRIGPEAT